MKKRDVKTISFVIFLVAITLMSFLLYPLFKDFESLATLDKNVESYGIRGIFILFTVQVFQVVAALIPGEVIEFASGLLYGSVGGFLICMAGLLVGEFFIFKMVSVWGQNLVELVLDKKSTR